MNLTTFFVNIGPQLSSPIKTDGKQYYVYLKTPISTCMFLRPIVKEQVIKSIYKFNRNKSAGHDDIGNFIVKRIAKEISVPLTLMFNTSISTGIVPDELEIAKVIPSYKKDHSTYHSNLRTSR